MRKPRNQTPKALASRRRNLAIARAARSMEPRPWRSGIESASSSNSSGNGGSPLVAPP